MKRQSILHDPAEPVERARYAQILPCDLTPDEVAAKAARLADQVGKLQEAQDRRAAAVAEMKEAERALAEEIKTLAAHVRTRTEPRSVDCVEYLYPLDQRIAIVRLDTGDAIGSRAAERVDLQDKLPLGDPHAIS